MQSDQDAFAVKFGSAVFQLCTVEFVHICRALDRHFCSAHRSYFMTSMVVLGRRWLPHSWFSDYWRP
jgi:hypothetical protein